MDHCGKDNIEHKLSGKNDGTDLERALRIVWEKAGFSTVCMVMRQVLSVRIDAQLACNCRKSANTTPQIGEREKATNCVKREEEDLLFRAQRFGIPLGGKFRDSCVGMGQK